MGEPLFFGGLVKHAPESVGEDGAHVGPDDRTHFHPEDCDRAHPTPAHASACAGEAAVAAAQPVGKAHRDSDSGQFVPDSSRGASPAEVTHLDLTSGPDAATVAANFGRPLIVPGHESNSPQNSGERGRG